MKRSVFSTRSKNRSRRYITGAIVVAIVAGLLFWQGQNGVNIGLSAFNTIIVPVQGAISGMVSSINGYFGKISYNQSLEREYIKLSEEYQQMEAEYMLKNEELSEAKREIERLTALLGYAEKYPEYDSIHARVIEKDPSNWFSAFVINRGTNQGVMKNMAVINDAGLIGRIIEAYPNSAVVRTIVDGRSNVSGIVDRTRDVGIVSGNLFLDSQSGDLCRMYYLPQVSELRPGDIVKTAGTDLFFHKGIPIGTVREISRSDTADKYVVIEPLVDFLHLEEVLIIRADVTEASAAEDSSVPVSGEEPELPLSGEQGETQ